MSGGAGSYAAQWWFFSIFITVLAGGVLVSAGAADWIVAITGQVCVLAGMFIAGFCYRERLTQLRRSPRWRAFQRMLR
jgi:hypothetical protein